MHKEKKIIRIFLWTALLLLAVGFCVVFADYAAYKYVSGKFSIYCYNKGEENKNIRYHQEFKTLEECGKPLKR